MKKKTLQILLIGSLMALCGCSSELVPQGVQEVINEKTDELKSKAIEELETALTNQIKDFMTSSDLQESLGLSEEQQNKIQSSLKEYLENYDSDPEDWKNTAGMVQDKLSEWKEKGELEGISVDELNEKLDEILSKENKQ